MTNWPNPANIATAWPNPLVAKEHCCEEAALNSTTHYIPCNQPAVSIIGWKGRSDKPIRMCIMCADHNIKNRGGEFIKPYWPENNNPTPSNPYDSMNEDQLLLEWQKKKDAIEVAKTEEMDLRKYIVKREFPKPEEGTNKKDLGNGYQLKAVVKYNYSLADNDTVESCLEKISNLGNNGAFIADRLVSWSPSFKLVEYRELIEEKNKGSKFAADALNIINEMLTIKEAAPTLEIVEPKKGKGK